MKMLFDFANNVSTTSNYRLSTNPTQTNDATDHRHSFAIDTLPFTK